MSLAEAAVFPKGPCPCGHGTIVQHVTSQADPWHGAEFHYSIDCASCAKEWRIEDWNLVQLSSEAGYRAARAKEEGARKEVQALVESLVAGSTASLDAAAKGLEFTERLRLELSNFACKQFFRHCGPAGRSSPECHESCSIPRLLSLAAERSREGELRKLLASYYEAKMIAAGRKIVRRRIG
jgi:hypothetical protein